LSFEDHLLLLLRGPLPPPEWAGIFRLFRACTNGNMLLFFWRVQMATCFSSLNFVHLCAEVSELASQSASTLIFAHLCSGGFYYDTGLSRNNWEVDGRVSLCQQRNIDR
jgi:hypothetical protein